jgi:hypothetical protein
MIVHKAVYATLAEAVVEFDVTLKFLEECVDLDLVATDWVDGELYLYKSDIRGLIRDMRVV